ncbi:MAG: hypothetical protein H6Q86_536 [candidate division NC10 bacterium]|jgi:hypothetical protein|nr:hypothetical protein [candidate division NC10 bacterium]
MGLLTVVLILAMLLWAMGFVVSGFVLAEEALWRRPGGVGSPPVSRTRKVGALLLLVIGGILVVMAIVTGVLVTEREAHLVRLETTVSKLEGELRALETKLNWEPTA